MKALITLAIAIVANAKPQISSATQFADGKIVGGEEAPKRKFANSKYNSEFDCLR